ncbi:hypothetical protein [Herbaspirillum sp. NPDC087042]|uniref:hypothetical protein n=1 Tax=Herbaspirillum sp. NPDC087042 TaxID=3364004 RepID=UPI0037F59FD5
MSSRVYLCCTDFSGMPSDQESDSFFSVSGTEYEANTRIPLFWLCLFVGSDIKIVPGGKSYVPESSDEEAIDEDFDEENHHLLYDDESYRPYAYLSCLRTEGIDQLKRRSEMMLAALGAECHALYLEWIVRLEAEPFQYILIRTEELDGMGDDGELEGLLRRSIGDLERATQTKALLMSSDINNLVGLSEDSVLSKCEAYELVGSANSALQWPSRSLSKELAAAEPNVAPPKKSKWMFWKR